MYNISEDVRSSLKNSSRQTVRINCNTIDNTLIEISDSDILIGGLTVERTSVSRNSIEIGNSASSECILKLNNSDGRYDDITFEGAELFVEVGIKDFYAPISSTNSMQGTGTALDPYQVISHQQLSDISAKVNANTGNYASAYYVLKKDINLSAYANWTPISSTSARIFSGVFDGKGHKIYNLTCSTTFAGLFGWISGTVKNLGIESGTITGRLSAGICGGVLTGTISSCYNRASIIGSGGGTGLYYSGGIVAQAGASTISDCINYGSITQNSTSTNTRTGAGISGFAITGTNVLRCVNAGAVTGVGTLDAIEGALSGTATGNYYNSETSIATSTRGTALATLQMSGNSALTNMSSLDFVGEDAVWKLRSNTYPELILPCDSENYIPIGYFTVDEPPRRLKSVTLSALDRMARFDKPYSSSLAFPATLKEILVDACDECNVTLDTPSTAINNLLLGYTVADKPDEENLTFRNIVAWCAQLSGSCAFANEIGHIKLAWYSDMTTGYEIITKSERYNHDIGESDLEITGVKIISNDDNGTAYLVGTDNYAFEIEGNLLAQNNLNTLAGNLATRLVGFSYRKYSATTKSLPHLWPMDRIAYVDKNNVSHTTIITDHIFRFNGNSEISGKGETASKKGYATSGHLTTEQRAILNRLYQRTQTDLTTMQQAQLDLNEAISGGMGLYSTTISEITYLHDKPLLEESTYICTQTTGGVAWTKLGWNGGSPTWEYGITADGNAVFNSLSLYRINAEILTANSITADKISVGASDKNFIFQWDLSNWVDSTYTTPSEMIIITDSPVGGISKARKLYSTVASVHTCYAPASETIDCNSNETYVFEGYYKASVLGMNFKIQLSERDALTGNSTNRWVSGDLIIDYSINTWTKFTSKLKLPSDWTGKGKIGLFIADTNVSGNVQFTGFTLKRANSGQIIVDGRISSVSGKTYFDLSTGEISAEGQINKMLLYDTSLNDGTADVQGIFWTDADTDTETWNNAGSTMFDSCQSLLSSIKYSELGIYTYLKSAGYLVFNAINDISALGKRIYISGTKGVNVGVLDSDESNNYHVGSGNRHNFYVNNTLACSIRSDGIYNSSGTKVLDF